MSKRVYEIISPPTYIVDFQVKNVGECQDIAEDMIYSRCFHLR